MAEKSVAWSVHSDECKTSDAEWCTSCDVDVLFTGTPLVRIRSSPIGQNNESRDWWKRFGFFYYKNV